MVALTSSNAFSAAVNSGDYTVRYSVVNSLQIPASVAKANNIERSGRRAIITVTLQKPSVENPYLAVPAAVTGTARTLIGTPAALDFRRVEAANSVYSIAAIPLDESVQTVTVRLEVTTLDDSAVIPVEFTQKLYSR